MTTFYKVISHRADELVWTEGCSYKKISSTVFHASILQAFKADRIEAESELVTVTTNTPSSDIKVSFRGVELTDFLVDTIQPLSAGISLMSPPHLLSWVRSSSGALRHILPAAQTLDMARVAFEDGFAHLIVNDDGRALIRKLSLEKVEAEIEALQEQMETLQKKRQSFLE